MGIRWGHALPVVVIAEALRVIILAVLVAIFGPRHWDASIEFAIALGAWVGPIAGFVLTLAGGWLVARGAAPGDRLKNGVVLGLMAALFDIAVAYILLGSQVMPVPLLLANLGRLVAGSLGGWLASRTG